MNYILNLLRHTHALLLLALVFLPNLASAQDPIQSPAGSYGASITSGLAPLQFQQFSLKTFFQEFISIPSAHAQSADIVTGLIGHWKFDETSGTTAIDSSGNNNMGTLTNGPTWTTGKIGGAVSFDGVDDNIILGNGSSGFSSAGTTHTIAFWINRASTAAGQYYVFDAEGGRLVVSMGLNATANNISLYDGTWKSLGAVPTGLWHHVVLVLNATNSSATAYLNGALLGSGAYAPKSLQGRIRIAGPHDGSTSPNLQGILDDFRIYDRALSASEIQTVYSIGNGTPPPSDTQAPTVSITAPSVGSMVSGSAVTVSANASDNVGVAGVQFKLDGANLGVEDATSPYSITWNSTTASNGSHTLTATARDAAGNQTTSSGVPITVNNTAPTADTQAPSIPTNLSATAVSSSQINLSWNASTDNVGVTGYRVYRGGTQITTVTGTTYQNTGLSPSTSYSYTVAAYDAAGNISGHSSSASATTQAGSGESNPIDSLQPGHWYRVPNSKLRTVLPNPVPAGNSPTSIIDAWSGGAFDTQRNRLIVWGGGHADYAGNEVYAFDINSLVWQRLTNPSPYTPHSAPSVNVNSDGTPVSLHTYDGLEYLQNVDRFLIHDGSRWFDGGAYPLTWVFDFQNLTWTRKADIPDCAQLERVSAYDEVTGHVFSHGPASCNSLSEYDPITNIWTRRSNDLIGYYKVASIDPNTRKFIAIGSGEMYSFDLQGTYTGQRITPSGATSILSTNKPGFDYDKVASKLVAWSGGASVYTLDTATWVWTKIDPAPTNTVIPTPANANGTYGRFRYIPSKNAFIVVSSIDEDVYVYKLSSGEGSPLPSDTQAPSAPSNLAATAQSSSQINLSWIASTDNVGVTGYRIERCQGSSCTTFAQIATPSGTSLSDTGLSANTAYRYQVRATDAAGNLSGYSSITSATTQASAPPPSTKFVISDRVQVSSGPLNVRSCASTSCSTLGTQPTGALGTISGGPTFADGFLWWNVNYDNVPDGWSAEDFLTKVSQPPPTGQINIQPGIFYALDVPDVNQGIGRLGTKHVTWAHNPLNGRLYSMGGDFEGPPAAQSYRQEMYSLSLTERWADKSNRNAGWRQEYPYCGPDGGIQPKSPDFIGWTWDSTRNVFWNVPGTFVGPVIQVCPDRSLSENDDPKYKFRHIMTFDPSQSDLTKRWTDRGLNASMDAGETWMSVYDPQTDTIIRFDFSGGSGAHVDIYNVVSKTWSSFALSLNALGQDIKIQKQMLAANIPARHIYAVDGERGRLHRYNIDTRTINDLGAVPGGTLNFGSDSDNNAYVVWDSVNSVLLFFRVDTSTMHVYYPTTATWENLATVVDTSYVSGASSGLKPWVRHGMVFDPYQNAVALLGNTDAANPYMYLYRYENAPPSDTQPPTVSLTATLSGSTVSGLSVAVSANASDNIGVVGVQFKLDGVNLGAEDTTSPYSLTWNSTTTSNGSHTLTAVARDAAGNTTTSGSVSVTVSNGAGGISVTVNPSSSWCSTINSAAPGTEIIFTLGNYSTTCNITVSGTATSPIVLRSQDALNPAIFNYPGSTSNIIEVRGSYITFRNFSFRPNSDAVDAIRILGGTRNIIIEKSKFEGTANIMISANSGNTQDLIVRDNTFVNLLNTPVYIGVHDGSASSQNLLFERNFIDNVNPPDPSIGYGIEVKLNSWATIRDNTVYRTKGPPIMVYGSNNGSQASLIEGNYTEGSVNEGGIVVGGGPAIVRNNVAVNNGYGGISVQNYGGRNLIQNIQIAHNTLINNFDSGINLSSWTSSTNVLAYNAILPRAGASAIRPAPAAGTNIGNTTCTSTCFVNAVTTPYDLWSSTSSSLLNAAGSGSESWRPADDFMGELRGIQADIGAFERTSSTANHLVGNSLPRPPRISATPPPTTLLGDLNLDGTVNNFDWNIMAGVWFTNDPTADINKDGIVNTADFYFIYKNWNQTG